MEQNIAPPVFLNILVGGQCNLKCRFCPIWKDPTDEMEAGDWANFFADLGEWLPGRNLTLSGGEPLAHPGIKQIVKSASDSGFKTGLCTSGETFTVESVEELAKWPLEGLTISIDGFEITHDYLRGRKGLYRTIMGFLDYLKDIRPDFRIVVSIVINRRNIEELRDFTRMLLDKPQVEVISFQAITYNSGPSQKWSSPEKMDLFPTAEQGDLFLDWLMKKKSGNDKIKNSPEQIAVWKRYFRAPADVRRLMPFCHIGNYTLTVNPSGNVRLCDFHEPIGSVKESNIKDIWYGEKAQHMREKMHQCDRFCNFLINCGFEDFHLRLLSESEQKKYFDTIKAWSK